MIPFAFFCQNRMGTHNTYNGISFVTLNAVITNIIEIELNYLHAHYNQESVANHHI